MAKRLCSVWGVLLEKNGFACKLESLCAIDPGAEKFKTHLKTPETLEIITLLKRKKPSGTGSGPDSCSPPALPRCASSRAVARAPCRSPPRRPRRPRRAGCGSGRGRPCRTQPSGASTDPASCIRGVHSRRLGRWLQLAEVFGVLRIFPSLTFGPGPRVIEYGLTFGLHNTRGAIIPLRVLLPHG